MKFSISILSDAASDLDEAYLWYEFNQPGLGALFIRNIEEAFEAISSNPYSFIRIHKNTRRFLVHKFPYGIYYLTDDKNREVKVVGVIHFIPNRNTVNTVQI
jgi:plasmid stabilization system protein ParE